MEDGTLLEKLYANALENMKSHLAHQILFVILASIFVRVFVENASAIKAQKMWQMKSYVMEDNNISNKNSSFSPTFPENNT